VQTARLEEAKAQIAALQEQRRQTDAEYRRTNSNDLTQSAQKATSAREMLVEAEEKRHLQTLSASRWTITPPFLMTIWAVKALEPSFRVRATIVPIFPRPFIMSYLSYFRTESVVSCSKSVVSATKSTT
jgi:hypothetical protein